MRDHPEYRKAIENETLPDEITDEHGNVMSPRAHLAIHVAWSGKSQPIRPTGLPASHKTSIDAGYPITKYDT